MLFVARSVWKAEVAKALLRVRANTGLSWDDMGDACACSGQTLNDAANEKHELGAYSLHRARLAWPDAFAALDALGRVG